MSSSPVAFAAAIPLGSRGPSAPAAHDLKRLKGSFGAGYPGRDQRHVRVHVLNVTVCMTADASLKLNGGVKRVWLVSVVLIYLEISV